MTRKRHHDHLGAMRPTRLLTMAATLLLVTLSGCATSTQTGDVTQSLVVGLQEVHEITLDGGTWDWTVGHEHDGASTTGEVQVFADKSNEGTRLIGRTLLREPEAEVSGTLEVEERATVKIMLEVFTTQGGDITVEWDFTR